MMRRRTAQHEAPIAGIGRAPQTAWSRASKRARHFPMAQWITAAAYVATVLLANWFIGHVGRQYSPDGPHVIPVGFGLEAPSGVVWIGAALVARDLVQRSSGRRFAVLAMLVGCGLSYAVAPNLAVASMVAFLLSETADLLVYTPLIRCGRFIASVFLSSTTGLVVDTVVFLWLAFGELTFWPGQVVGKLWATIVACGVIWAIRSARSMRSLDRSPGRVLFPLGAARISRPSRPVVGSLDEL